LHLHFRMISLYWEGAELKTVWPVDKLKNDKLNLDDRSA
jgi:hypothetical protein